jgi:adenosylhomocysteine nucleosidase
MIAPVTESQAALISQLLQENPLFVFALDSEAAGIFDDVNALIVGIGKVNAAYHLTKAIAANKPGIIVNLGSAGSNAYKRGEVVCCTRFVQRDMDVRALGYELYETPLSGEAPLLQYGLQADGLPSGICGTGDNFEVGHTSDAYDVIDMEAYPLAWIAKKENIPFLCLKYISDGADDNAAEEWMVSVHNAAVALKATITQLQQPAN